MTGQQQWEGAVFYGNFGKQAVAKAYGHKKKAVVMTIQCIREKVEKG